MGDEKRDAEPRQKGVDETIVQGKVLFFASRREERHLEQPGGSNEHDGFHARRVGYRLLPAGKGSNLYSR